MIDMHIHLLPGIDDGSKSMEETEKMLEIIRDDGIAEVIVTPHFYRGYYENNHEDVVKLTEEVNRLSVNRGIGVKLYPGQEVFLDSHSIEEYEKGHIAALAGTDYMLVEFSMEKMPHGGFDIIYELKIRGIRPIMAHPERYRYIIENPENINEFIDEGCLIQINAGSICGKFGSRVKKTADILVKNGICSFIGSDAHSSSSRRPGLSEAMEIAGAIDSKIAKTAGDNALKLLANEHIDLCSGRVKIKKGFFSFFRK
ncbi:MAG: exopolysaccharide biosynthesis protein [Clostridium sp.]|jgi:protein-tyrosine phosphatase|uniref:tyrosine-protein phosphatase n=1 Tax=Clostridium sp. TaxID=1506 RepID=UPI0025BBC8B5|nr:CpsB/CapC family capsule biosynthesis tyrosine phosphatase [Clostridium sp.]MCH3965050.1 exopolysaccharide biosynthesis protein [Clostridium sp.]MCI1714271.1 exopolysaccharide biosynthesis protein [Clostridium sp.]MCI1798533.1 exopolysaccharide biosynthesis protein [Clostridium sp.]MCI1812736.1 exopolysaccharide biosynthesis protein [Clostridium sp.]MCI1869342.1 exopolysaccharide biosynthesis protein [Clostridium sp.]